MASRTRWWKTCTRPSTTSQELYSKSKGVHFLMELVQTDMLGGGPPGEDIPPNDLDDVNPHYLVLGNQGMVQPLSTMMLIRATWMLKIGACGQLHKISNRMTLR
ncbi:unnamed protein product [Urochloa humidicola]